jgi:hypothetical protein
MAETGDLIIKIGGDASKFKATIADVENSLKSFKANLGTTGLNIKIEALGFQEAKSNIKGVADFAEGTLGAIKNTIKDVKAERLTISADPNSLAPFNIKLNELNTTVKELEKAGILKNVPQEAAVATNSLQGLTNKLNELRKQRAIIDPDTNARGILQINQQIDKLQEKIVNLNNLGQRIDSPSGVVGGFQGIKKGSAEAGRALTSLSLIAQDLPFGFIGIQNNLPAVIQSFGQLKASAPAAGGALSALGSALVGPAGLFFAFSAVTSLVTVAVQEYGSLSNAVKVLTSSNSEALKSQLALNKALTEESGSIGGRIAQIKILVENYQREGATQLERLAAFRALKAINPDIVAGIDEQNYSTAASIKLVGENANAIINLLKVQAKQQAISKVLDGLEQKRFEANGKYNAERKKQIDFENRLAAIDAKKAKGISLTSPERSLDRQRAIGAKAYADNVKEASDEISVITTEQDKWYNSLKPLVSETSNANSAFETLIDNLKDLRKGQKEAAKGTKELKEELQGVIPLFDLLLPSKEQFNFDFLKEFFGPNFIKQLKESQRKINEAQKGIDKFKQGDTFAFLPDQAPTFRPSDTFTKDLLNQKKLAKEFEDAKNVLNDVFFAPVSDLFQNFFDTGKFAFKEFGTAILSTIKSIVSKIIATGIINLLANILLPGSSVAGNVIGGAATGAKGGILGAFKAAFNSVLDISKPGQANFGGIRGNDGVNMSGQVVMTLRGADLVGAMNRTNTTISRVG